MKIYKGEYYSINEDDDDYDYDQKEFESNIDENFVIFDNI